MGSDTGDRGMGLQEILVFGIVLAAIGYGGLVFYRKGRSFSPKHGCANDCGCSANSGTANTSD